MFADLKNREVVLVTRDGAFLVGVLKHGTGLYPWEIIGLGYTWTDDGQTYFSESNPHDVVHVAAVNSEIKQALAAVRPPLLHDGLRGKRVTLSLRSGAFLTGTLAINPNTEFGCHIKESPFCSHSWNACGRASFAKSDADVIEVTTHA
jgi:small nuclear ribonucleoprotein (snRNP)-like protein